MIGQGGPSSLSRKDCTSWLFIKFVSFLLVAVSFVESSVANSYTDEQTMKLRIAWGGGQARQWHGRITLSNGRFGKPQPLGLKADEPGSMWIENEEVRILQRSPRSYEGLDLSVTAPLDAILRIELTPFDQNTTSEIKVSLKSLVSEESTFALGDQRFNNHLLIRRAPGDDLQILFDAPSLVFSAGEQFQFNVVPHLIQASPGSSMLLSLELTSNGQVHWKQERTLLVGTDQKIASVEDFLCALPHVEGVYDLNVILRERRFSTNLLPSKPIAQRKLQLVVINQRIPLSVISSDRSELIDNHDPANPSRLKNLIPNSSRIPGLKQKTLKHGNQRSIEHLGNRFVQLDPGAWQALPLNIDELNVPHILEIEYPNDIPQILGISIVQPDASQKYLPIGLDSGIEVTELASGNRPAAEIHRITFWPRSKDAWILLTNFKKNSSAVFGKIRVFRNNTSPLPRDSGFPDPDERMLVAYFDKPIFAESFSADKALDEMTGRTMDDWHTFYQGGSRLIQHLRQVGYNAAMISVFNEGSTLYPSELLEPTPKFDSGIYFASGQDPKRKDVLEMVFRMFDRAGMKLIPALHFSSPLPEIEKLLRESPESQEGIHWVNAEGNTWLEANSTHRDLAPYYNTLDERVQTAMLNVVNELAAKYGHHRSFAGISLQLSANGYAQLQGSQWGFDDHTVARFEKAKKLEIPISMMNRYENRALFLTGEARKPWLQWREESLRSFYHKIHQTITTHNSLGRLYLAGSELLLGPDTQRDLLPTLPPRDNIEQILLELGMDPASYKDSPGIVWLRPRRLAPVDALSEQAINLKVNHSRKIDDLFSKASSSGSLFLHEPQELRLESFDKESPFGENNTYTKLYSQISPAGYRNRQRFIQALRSHDSQTIVEGGWLAPLGQNEALQDIFALYRRLPSAKFNTYTHTQKKSNTSVKPVIVRTLRQEGNTYIYLLNDSAWPVTTTIQLSAPHGTRLDPLVESSSWSNQISNGRALTWNITLDPFDMEAGIISSSNVEINRAETIVPQGASKLIEKRIAQMSLQVEKLGLSNKAPLNRLSNPGFELAEIRNGIPGWQFSRGPNVSVSIEKSQLPTGVQSLKVRNFGRNFQRPVWVRSDPFEPPKTGRLEFRASLRVEDPTRQPNIILAIEGNYKGQEYYRPSRPVKLSREWTQYTFPLHDLPLTGLDDIRVEFILEGEGEVWIDDIQLFDLRFAPSEIRELNLLQLLSQHHLENRHLSLSAQILDGYWPRFLSENVPINDFQVSNIPSTRKQSTRPTKPAPKNQKPSRTGWFKKWIPDALRF